MADGHVNKCKECNKKDVTKNREDKADYYKDYDKGRANLPHRVEARKAYAKTDVGRTRSRKAKDKYATNNPKLTKARYTVSNAIRDGKLIRPDTCEGCKKVIFAEAHHCDYNKPLEVVWLCDRCHKDWHLENDPTY